MTLLDYLCGALIFGGVFLGFFTSHRIIADLLMIAGVAMIMFAQIRNRRRVRSEASRKKAPPA